MCKNPVCLTKGLPALIFCLKYLNTYLIILHHFMFKMKQFDKFEKWMMIVNHHNLESIHS